MMYLFEIHADQDRRDTQEDGIGEHGQGVRIARQPLDAGLAAKRRIGAEQGGIGADGISEHAAHDYFVSTHIQKHSRCGKTYPDQTVKQC